jgi:hypothetical protein
LQKVLLIIPININNHKFQKNVKEGLLKTFNVFIINLNNEKLPWLKRLQNALHSKDQIKEKIIYWGSIIDDGIY